MHSHSLLPAAQKVAGFFIALTSIIVPLLLVLL